MSRAIFHDLDSGEQVLIPRMSPGTTVIAITTKSLESGGTLVEQILFEEHPCRSYRVRESHRLVSFKLSPLGKLLGRILP